MIQFLTLISYTKFILYIYIVGAMHKGLRSFTQNATYDQIFKVHCLMKKEEIQT